MNCTQIRRFLYAFADGELSVKDNCEVLDHLKMCPPCARIVADQQSLRRVLHGSLVDEPVPAEVLARLQQAARRRVPVATPSGFRSGRWAWAAAAVLVLAAGLGYFGWPHAVTDDSRQTTLLAAAVAEEVVDTHCACCKHSRAEHQARDLPNTLEGLRDDKVAAQFGDRMEIMIPDFAVSGFSFESVNRCSVEDDRPGLHIIYRNPRDNERLSFFSVPRCDMKGCAGFCNHGRRTFYVDHRKHDGIDYAIVGWQCSKGRSSFLACAPMKQDDLLTLLDTVRMVRSDCRPHRWATPDVLRRWTQPQMPILAALCMPMKPAMAAGH